MRFWEESDRPGDRVALRGDDGAISYLAIVEKLSSLEHAQAVVAAWRDRAVLVAIDPGSAAVLPAFAGKPIALIAPGGGWFSETIELDDSLAPAQISFSSGTTGQPKPILISRRAISDTCRRLIDVMGIDGSIREYIGVPLTYSFGLARLRTVAAAGGRSFLPENGFRIDEFARMLEAGEVNALSAVPTLLRLVIQQAGQLAQAGRKLRWLEIGSQFMAAEEKMAVARIFPNARIVQHYGLTEASRTTFLRIDGADAATLAGVGRAVGDVRIKVDADGRICIAGPHLAEGLLTADGLIPTTDDDGWLRTSDLGEIRDGELHFLGRADDLINVSGIKVPAGFLEQNLLKALGDETLELAVAARADPLRGQALLVAHGPDVDLAALRIAADRAAKEWNLAPSDIELWPIDRLPRTETGKVKRNALSDFYAAEAEKIAEQQAGQPVSADRLRAFYQSLSPRHAIDSDASFASLKGDSLSYVQATILIEEAIGSLPAGWEALSIGALEARMSAGDAAEPARGFKAVEGEMLARTFAITLIAASHAWWPDRLLGFPLAGGSSILLVVFGLNLFRFRSGILLSSRPFEVVPSIFVRYILPYYAVILIFSLKEGFDWRNFALIGVFFSGPSGALHMYWFFESLIQMTLIIAALFAIPALRVAVRDRLVPTMIGLVLAAIALRLGLDAVRPLWRLAPRTPDACLFLAIGGMALAALPSLSARVAISALLVATVLWTMGANSWPVVLAIGLAPILFLPRVRVPTPLAICVRAIASSTIYIYLASRLVIAVCEGPLRGRYPVVEFLATLVVGVALGEAVRGFEAMRYRKREQRKAAALG